MKTNGPILHHPDDDNLRKLSIADAYRRADGDEGGRLFLEIETFSNQKHSYALSPPKVPLKSDLFCWQYLIMLSSAFCMICFSGWLAMKLSHRNVMRQGFQQLNETKSDNIITESIVKLYQEINDIPSDSFACKEIVVNITPSKENNTYLPIVVAIGDVPSSWKSMMTERSKFPVNTVFLKFIGIQSESHYAVEQLTHVVNAIFNGVMVQDKSKSSIVFYNFDLNMAMELANLANNSILVKPKISNETETIKSSLESDEISRVLIMTEYLDEREYGFNKIFGAILDFQINIKIYREITVEKAIEDIYKFIED